MGERLKYMLILAVLFLFITVHGKEDNDDEGEEHPGQAAGVTYDSRSLLIDGKRELLFSGSVHYPRMPVEVKKFNFFFYHLEQLCNEVSTI